MKSRTAGRCLLFLIAMLLLSAVAAADDSAFFAKGDGWPETMTASRTLYRAWQGDQAITPGPWYATAPLKEVSFTSPSFPAQGVDLDARNAAGKRLWRKKPGYVDGETHGLPGVNRASTYLFRTIHAREAVTVSASLGSDDGIEIWLNDEKLLSRDVACGLGRNQDRVDLALKAGENRLLFRVHNNTGAHGFFFEMRHDPLFVLWGEIERDYPLEAGWMKSDLPSGGHLAWFRADGATEAERALMHALLEDLGEAGSALSGKLENVAQGAPASSAQAATERLRIYAEGCRIRDALKRIERIDTAALRRSIEDLAATYPERYGDGREFLARLDSFDEWLGRSTDMAPSELVRVAADRVEAFEALRVEALLANPLLAFDEILLVKRTASSPKLGLPQNWQGNCSLPRTGFDDALVTLSLASRDEGTATLFKPEKPGFIGDVDLHFDGDRMLFSSLGSHNRWQIFEVDSKGQNLRQVTPGEHADVDNYDACYLPDGRIIFDSTRCFQGIPCVGGSDQVANLFIMDEGGGNMRQLCFDQDHDWCPTVLNNGRVLYTRWEYSDTPHYFTRILFHMNPDGTGQMEYYGSNSFWPNSLFYARPIPGHATRFVGIVSGHHGVPRMGELVLFDPSLGRREADGVIQRIPGFGKKVDPVIVDQLVNNSWPRFLHPFPLSGKYFLVSCQPAPGRPWGLYLADVFDSLLCLREEPGFGLFEPLPLRPSDPPPVIPDRTRPETRDALVYLADVYTGEGLDGVPRGAVKRLRVYEFHYAYNKMGGHAHIGMEGPWDVRRILGTVPVCDDGSAAFVVPANTPIAVQPLDSEGRALQMMRSWFTAMPGEVLSCVGCHEPQNQGPPSRRTLASLRAPSAIEPWHGPARGFSFKREVQPVLDRYCVGCHDGAAQGDGLSIPDLTAKEKNGWGNFTPSYLALHPYVRRPGPESDYRLQRPLEFHTNTSELIQMLAKGHHGVTLDDEGWDRLVTWIDLNVPDHGTWGEQAKIPGTLRERRIAMRTRHANRPEDPEAIPLFERPSPTFVKPDPVARPASVGGDAPRDVDWPFNGEVARRRQAESGHPATKRIDLGEGVTVDFVLVPAGAFIPGDKGGCVDEGPRAWVAVEKPFYIARTEVTCAQYSRFDESHRNGFLDQRHKDHTTPGYPVDEPDLPVIRISWEETLDFCDWFSRTTGETCTLPTEAEWEWACRAGADTPFWYGSSDDDFSSYANLADVSTRLLAVTGVNPKPIANPNQYQDYLPKDERYNDGERFMTTVGKYGPNAWGICDMHGNVWEWTLSAFGPYPYKGDDGRNDPGLGRDRVVRGGSWRDRPERARAGYRLSYRPYQRVFNVGFRVVLPIETPFSGPKG